MIKIGENKKGKGVKIEKDAVEDKRGGRRRKG